MSEKKHMSRTEEFLMVHYNCMYLCIGPFIDNCPESWLSSVKHINKIDSIISNQTVSYKVCKIKVKYKRENKKPERKS